MIAWAACSMRELWWRQVCRPPVRGWMCLQEISKAASSSSSPAAMTVTRTSSSAELMASDKCVMGELSGPEVHGSSFYERETLQLYFVRMAWAMITGLGSAYQFQQVSFCPLRANVEFGEILISKCASNMILLLGPETIRHIFVINQRFSHT